MKKVRIRNIDYALTGSVDIQGKKPIMFRLEPNKWTEVPDVVYTHLKNKYGNPQTHDVPAALPSPDGNYYGYPGQTRTEQHLQYLIEFA